MAPRILVVEDDENLRLGLRDCLEDEGYRVEAAADRAAAEAALAAGGFGLVILDVMLPDGDGRAICRGLRAAGDRTPVLMLTARSLEGDVVDGLDAGADDYLTKPFRLRELLARVRARLRSTAGSGASDTLGTLTVDRAARTVRDGEGGEIALTRRELDILLHLLARPGVALSRDAILDAVWGHDVVVDPRTIDNFVSNLKRKLGWRPEDSWRIASVRGIGYRLEREDSEREG